MRVWVRLRRPLNGPLRIVSWALAVSIPAGLITLLVYISMASKNASVAERLRRAKCLGNVFLIASKEIAYARDHGGRFSQRLSELCPEYITEDQLDVFACPSAGTPRISRRDEIDSKTSYILRKGLTLASHGREMLVYEKPGNHGGEGINAAFVDGHAQWITASQLTKIMAKDENGT